MVFSLFPRSLSLSLLFWFPLLCETTFGVAELSFSDLHSLLTSYQLLPKKGMSLSL